ncbi:MAG: hypothetical protein WCT51_02770 [Candidatus Shapirobacteria bacterium]|jgi:hypothetical protein
MANLQEIQNLQKEALKTIKKEIDGIGKNEEFSKEKRGIMVETMLFINLVFKAIRENSPEEAKNLLVKFSLLSKPVLQELEKNLNKLSINIFVVDETTLKITTTL